MENQEAIEILKDLWRYEHSEYYEQEVREALEKGIEALENQKSVIEELERLKDELSALCGENCGCCPFDKPFRCDMKMWIDKKIAGLKGENK